MNSIRVLVCGDYYPSHLVRDELNNNRELFDYNFQRLLSSADYSIVNLESPVFDNDSLSGIPKSGPLLHGYPEGVDYIKDMGFNMVTLANNHILDYGYKGLEKTLGYLKSKDLNYVGAGLDKDEVRAYRVISVGDYSLGIINVCEHEFSVIDDCTFGANPLEISNVYYDIQSLKSITDFIIIIIHGGHEHYQLPSFRMKKTYRLFIDMGADVVINGHQHCFSGYEKYNSKYVFYGLGNFLFNRLDDNKMIGTWNEGISILLSFKINKDRKEIGFGIYPYKQCVGGVNFCLYQKDTTEHKKVDNKIQELNAIIDDDAKLKYEFEQMSYTRRYHYLMLLTQFRSRLLKGLCYRGLIPDFISSKRLLIAKNCISCESHRDIFQEFINSKINIE